MFLLLCHCSAQNLLGTTLTEFCDGLIDVGLSRLPPADTPSKRPRYQGSIKIHHKLLEHGRAVIKDMATDPRIKKVATPIMFHPDLHKRNIFVSDDNPTIITAIIDWQSSSIEPAFWYADQTPDFARPTPDPADGNRLQPKSEACARAHNAAYHFLMPRLSEPRRMDESFFRPFRSCYRTWADSAVALREELIQTSQQWKELGFKGSCPFPIPQADEILAHQKQYQLFEAAQQLKHVVASTLDAAIDGWVPLEIWEETKALHEELYRMMLQTVLECRDDEDEPIRDEVCLREVWPFDLEE
jgi:hypothetical protein